MIDRITRRRIVWGSKAVVHRTAVAVQPDVLLMIYPCPSLDPISTMAIVDLISELKLQYTIVITHNMQQAASGE